MNQELVFFENEIIRIKKEYGSRYFSKPNFHAVLKDLSPNIDEKILIVFRVADFLSLYAKFAEFDTLEEDIKSIRLTELKQRFTKESAIDPNTADYVFWAYMYGNNMVLDKPSSFINIIEEQDDNTKHHVLGEILASLLLRKHNINENIETVTIGKQVWMAKNLNVDKFRNGEPIPQAKTDSEWLRVGENKQPAWCYYDNDPANGERYGKLYNWYAVNDSRGLAPAGWHIPTDKEWLNLTYYLGEREVVGTKMKSASGWKDEGNGNNESGFSGLPGGGRRSDGTFYDIGGTGCLWSSTEISSNSAWRRFLFYNFGGVSQDRFTKGSGFSVRCLRD